MPIYRVQRVRLVFEDHLVDAGSPERAAEAAQDAGAKALRVLDEGGAVVWDRGGLVILPAGHPGVVE